MDYLLEIGIDKFYVITGYKEGAIKSYFKYNIDADVTFIHQKKRTGTADALYLVKDYVSEDFILLAGDTIFDREDLEYLSLCQNSLLYTERYEKLYEYGTMEIRGGRIRRIHEKSTDPISNFVNCSAYHFTKDVFRYIPKTEIDPRFGERIITNTINLMLDDGYRFRGIPIEHLNEISYPEDINIIEERLR